MEGEGRKYKAAFNDDVARKAVGSSLGVYREILRRAGARLNEDGTLSKTQLQVLAQVCMLIFNDKDEIGGLDLESAAARKLVDVLTFPANPKKGEKGLGSLKNLNETALRLQEFEAGEVFGDYASRLIGEFAGQKEDEMKVRRCARSDRSAAIPVTIKAMKLAPKVGGRAVVDFKKILDAFKARWVAEHGEQSPVKPLVVDLVIFVLNVLLSMFVSYNIQGIKFVFVADGGKIINPDAAYHCIHRLRKFFCPKETKCRLAPELIEVLEGKCEFRKDEADLCSHYLPGFSYTVQSVKGTNTIYHRRIEGVNNGEIDLSNISARAAWLAVKFYISIAWPRLKNLPLWLKGGDRQASIHFGVEHLFGIFQLKDPAVPDYAPLYTAYEGGIFHDLWENRGACFFTEAYYSRYLFMLYIYEHASYRHLPSQWRLVSVAEGEVVIKTGETHDELTDKRLKNTCERQVKKSNNHVLYRYTFSIVMSPKNVLDKIYGEHTVGGAQSNGANG